ncbi:cytochrome c biogenesis protein CcdA [Gemmobacter lanyuensis]|uniref:Cytochrome c-type biogenesis protein n=1 Tax=Gemmobacter lanyuensis TaxID=1054497 RepID=A0A918MG45_9RHOB|nr:cytochrome c-type biogenesis protein [Gemmobacter lanyuensis]GGW21777.1 cytochrome c biogenesis protein CcdA [Gemmobacter lanyuensis]
MNRLTIALCLSLLTTPVLAVQPDEILPDPALEARAREISKLLRCPVCQGENIDDSNADISRDLRLMVRERLLAGDSNDAVVDYVVDRYGEFVLFEPRATGANLLLWLAGPGMLILGGGIAFLWVRSRRNAGAPAALTPEEEARLREILKE